MCTAAGRLLLLGLAVLAAITFPARSFAADSPLDKRRVVFVCEHGSVKSLIAASYFNRSVQARGLPYRAIARGIAPEPTVPAAVQQGLGAIGIDVSTYVPQRFEPSDADGAWLVVSFDQDITAAVGGRARHLKWDNLPDVLPGYTRGRDEILTRVESLIDELSRGRSP